MKIWPDPMNPSVSLRRRILALAAAATLALIGQAPALAAQAFETGTWAELQRQLPRPAIVVFSTRHCPNCPEVFETLLRERQQRRPRAPVVAVLMDPAGDPESTRQPHLRRADRLFAFQGSQQALRYSVDPAWRGVTPYVALLPQGGPAIFVAGTPSSEHWNTWQGTGQPTRR